MMTPKENYMAVSRGEKPDQIPIYATNMIEFLHFYYDVPIRTLLDDPDIHVDVTARSVQEFGFDCVVPGIAFILFGCGPEIGVEWEFLGHNLPGTIGGLINSEDDISKITIPSSPSGYFFNYIQILSKLNKRIGDTVFVLGFVLGPFSTACFLRGIENTMLDAVDNVELFKKYIPLCVDFSIHFGKHVLEVGLPTCPLLEIFVSPDLIGSEYYHKNVAPYDNQVCSHFEKAGLTVPNTYSPFMGNPGDKESQRVGRDMYDYFWGTKESIEVIRRAIKHSIPGYPGIISMSGRMLVEWSADDIMDFLKEALNLLVKENQMYPAIRLASLQTASREETQDVAEKLKMIIDIAHSYPL